MPDVNGIDQVAAPQGFITLSLAVDAHGQLYVRQLSFQGVPHWSEVHRLLLNGVHIACKETLKDQWAQWKETHPVEIVPRLPKELQG
jgi:hypothetical protein